MARPRLALCGLGKQVEGLRWESDSRLRVGRNEALDIVVNHPSLSREHGEILLTANGWIVRDIGSTNGTFLNNERLEEAGRLVLPNDRITFGRVAFRVEVADAGSRAGQSASVPSATIQASGTCFSLKAVTRRSWERAVERLERAEDHRMWPARRILPLLRAGHYLTQLTSLDDLLRALLGEVVTVLDAQRGAIVLADEATGELRLRAACAGTDTISLANCFSETLADRCYREGESMLCADVRVEKDLESATSVAQGTMASIICGLLRTPRSNQGVLHLDRGPLQEPFTEDDFEFVDAVACYISVGIESARMLEQQRDLFLHAATTLAQTVEMRDAYTGGHTQRVTVYALLLAEELRLSPAEKHALEIATPLHDIGKIAVDDAILRKAERLTEAEDMQMRSHVTRGATLLANIPGLTPMLPIVRNHHERWDGQGYPDGQQGEQIPSVARVVAIADAFDAMTSDRPYRKALSLGDAFRELSAKAGTHFDPTYVAAFLRLRSKLENVIAANGRRASA